MRDLCFLGFAVSGVLAGCSCESPTDAASSKVPGSCQTRAPLVQPVKTDILFVVDDSGSMAEEQAEVSRELPVFVAELQKGGGVAQDFQVGVTTTSVYSATRQPGGPLFVQYDDQGGWLRQIPLADGGAGSERFLGSADPELVPRFSQLIAGIGILGSGQETPFEAARVAVLGDGFFKRLPDGGNPNVGFLRDGARLLVVVVSDEDDCSEMVRPPTVNLNDVDKQNFCVNHQDMLGPVGDYVSFFTGLPDSSGAPGRTREVIWGAIAPVSRSTKQADAEDGGQLSDGGVAILQNVDCPTSAAPGFRHRQMALAFDSNLDNLASICAASYAQGLLDLAKLANANQTLELDTAVPDPRLLELVVARDGGTEETCTVANGGIGYEPGGEADGGTVKPRVHFQASCVRRSDDTGVTVKLICVG